eukprot:2038483-Rhodomonas_salina.3
MDSPTCLRDVGYWDELTFCAEVTELPQYRVPRALRSLSTAHLAPYASSVPVWRYATCGTELAYGATRRVVLSSRTQRVVLSSRMALRNVWY